MLLNSCLDNNIARSRVSPVCVSLCNDFNCLYITGESDHRMGLEAVGNSSDVWKFHFATSLSFSLVEQLVGNNIWNTTKIGSVTLGLIESYLNNETLELFYSNGYLFLKRENDNNTLLFLDMDTGIVRDIFSDYGLLGTMPCYHDNITDNAWAYGCNLLDKNSSGHSQLMSVSNGSVKNIFNLELFDLLAYVFKDFDAFQFMDDFIIGIGASELVSIGAVMVGTVAMGVVGPEFLFVAVPLIAIGEIGLAYSDGIFDNPNVVDWVFFAFDSIFSLAVPFSGGGFKIGSQTLKLTIERLFLKCDGNILERLFLRINHEEVTWSLGKIIYENLFNKPIIEYIRDWKENAFNQMLHHVFSVSFDYFDEGVLS